ncbi:11932_t:CDS:2, partial [Ambispora leptoticha]
KTKTLCCPEQLANLLFMPLALPRGSFSEKVPLTSNPEQSGEESPAIQSDNSLNQLEPDNIAKFQQRQSQTQAINHDYLPDLKGALKGFYEENVKETIETKTHEFKQLIQQNAAIGKSKYLALGVLTVSVFLPVSMFVIEPTPAKDNSED